MILLLLWSTLHGKVVGISDGDTITVLVDETQVKVRLHGIDCPEKGQPFGNRATQLTSKLVFGKQVTVKEKGKDRYGRVIGMVWVDGVCLNYELLKNGLAWWYRKYAKDEMIFADYEKKARGIGYGLWADKDPVPPWEWRKKKK